MRWARLYGSLALAAGAEQGAHILRVHDVAQTVDVVRMIAAVDAAEKLEGTLGWAENILVLMVFVGVSVTFPLPWEFMLQARLGGWDGVSQARQSAAF